MFCSLTSLVIPTPKHDEVLNETPRIHHAARGRCRVRPIERSERQADLFWQSLASLNPQAWHVRMRAPGLAATPSCLSRRLGLTRVPLPLLSRLALGKIAELERPRRYPKAFGTTSNLLSGTPPGVPCPRSDACRAKELPSMVGCSAAEQSGRSLCPGISAKALLRST